MKKNEESNANITPSKKKWWNRNLSSEERKLIEEDSKYFLHQCLSTPVLTVLSKCHGIYIEDLQGKQYMDFHGNSVHNVGFSNLEVIKAIKSQLDKPLTFCTRRYTNLPAIKLAKKLAKITPGDLNKSLFCTGGSDAIEIALKLARVTTHRFKTISYWDAFHGASFGSISVGGDKLFRGNLGPLLPGTIHIEYPQYYRNSFGYKKEEDIDKVYLEQIERIFEREPDISAFIGEPLRVGPFLPTKNYWEGVRKICDEHGTLLVFDEIAVDFGRTGKMFACEHYVTPDILVYGKAFGGGILPFAGIIAREDLDMAETKNRALGHYTHEKNPLCCAAALATIEYIEKYKICKHAAEIGEYAMKRLNEMKDCHQIIGNVGGKGLLIGIELVKYRDAKEKATKEAEMVMYKCLEKGLSFDTTMGNMLALIPPLIITREEMEKALNILEESVDEVERGLGY